MTTRVGILGATGAVGQRLIQLLDPHPDFEIAALTASADSQGRAYRKAAKWRAGTPIPSDVADIEVQATDPSAVPDDVELVFSSLPSSVGATVEPAFANAGYLVSSNSSNERMAPDFPLIIPELNADHIEMLDVQRDNHGWDGGIVKNPNCSTITVTPTLAALQPYGIERAHVATLQAVSGAGYSGVTSMEIIDNVIPHIGGEEEKIEEEPEKLLGTFDGAEIELADLGISASCNRVPTIDGHLENAWVDLADEVDLDTVASTMEDYPSLSLHSSPEQFIHVFESFDRPQPRIDRDRENGMQISVGGIQGTAHGVQYNVLAHNTMRGAAGASVLNGELLLERGYL